MNMHYLAFKNASRLKYHHLRFKHSKNEENDEEKDIRCEHCDLVNITFYLRSHIYLL